jgi:hypothetical protein
MALLNGITGLQKGVVATVTLDKTTLFGLSGVLADDWFSSQTNVKSVRIMYKSTQGNQKKAFTFNLAEATPSCQILFSIKARSSFEVEKIVLIDYEKDILSLEGAQIPSGLNITF